MPLPANAGIESSLSKAVYSKKSFNTPCDVQPGTVTIAKSILNSAEVKAALVKLRKVGKAPKATGAEFEADMSNFDIAAALKPVKIF